MRHLLRILIGEARRRWWIYWGPNVIIVSCSIQVQLLRSCYWWVRWRCFWLLVLCLLVHILILICWVHLLIEIVHLTLVARETLRDCRCSPVSLKASLLILLVWHGIFTIRIHRYLALGQHLRVLGFVSWTWVHFHLRLIWHILIVLAFHLWFLILWSNDLHLFLIVWITFHIYKIWIYYFKSN